MTIHVTSLLRLVAVLVAATLSCAQAQTNTTPLNPFVYPGTVGTSPVQVLPQSDQRRSVEFCNPNPSATCAVCPVRSRGSGSPAITCAVNGAGSVTLPPTTCWGKNVTQQESPLRTAWNAICSLTSQNFSAFETE